MVFSLMLRKVSDFEVVISVFNRSNFRSFLYQSQTDEHILKVRDFAEPELRHKGDLIVASNNDHGVAEVIQRFILA